MRKNKLFAAFLALVLCSAGCSGKDAPVSSRQPPGSSSEPASVSTPASEPAPAPAPSQPEEIPPLQYSIRPLPPEQMMTLSEDGFGWSDMGAPFFQADWVDENRLLFFSYRSDPIAEISDCRVFLYDIAAQQMTNIVDSSFPALSPEVFYRDGVPYVNFAAKDAVTLRLNLAAGSYETRKGGTWNLSRKGLVVTMLWGKGVTTIRDGMDPDRAIATYQMDPAETFHNWSPDGEYMSFQIQSSSKYSIYTLGGEKLLEFAPQLWSWDWCQTPGYLTYTPRDKPVTDRILLNFLDGTETVLPTTPEQGYSFLLREPEFSLLNNGGASMLLDHRTGEEIPLGLGELYFAVYHPESSTIVTAMHKESADSREEWLGGYLITVER